MNVDQLERENADLRRALQATEQALLDERAAHRHDAVMAGPAHALYEAMPDGPAMVLPHHQAQAWYAFAAAHRATTPSQTPPTHVVVAVDRLKHLEALEHNTDTAAARFTPAPVTAYSSGWVDAVHYVMNGELPEGAEVMS